MKNLNNLTDQELIDLAKGFGIIHKDMVFLFYIFIEFIFI